MNQTEEEKKERRRIRKKQRRVLAGSTPTTPPEEFTGYRTTPEFREKTRNGAHRLWEQGRDKMMLARSTEAHSEKASSAATKRWDTPGSREKASRVMRDYYADPEHREQHAMNMSLALDTPEFRAKCAQRVGPLAGNWQGGLSFEPYCYKFNSDFRRNVRHFFNHQCVLCLYEGQKMVPQEKLLNVHHVHYDKRSLCNDSSPRMFAPLCDSHHGMTNNNREFWENLLEEIIKKVYNGQSYYCEEEWTKIKRDLQMPAIAPVDSQLDEVDE